MALRKNELMRFKFGTEFGHQCKECKNLCFYEANRKYFKCSVYGNTNSEASDWKLSYEACGMFNKDYDGLPVIKLVSTSKKEMPQIKGQIEMEG